MSSYDDLDPMFEPSPEAALAKVAARVHALRARRRVKIGSAVGVIVVTALASTAFASSGQSHAARVQVGDEVSTTTIDDTSTTGTTDTTIAPTATADGEVEGVITIPKIGVNFYYVEGTSHDDLEKGPGHYPETPLPGTIGNAAIAGHRTTYTQPFADLDKLVPGDEIIIQTLQGTTFVYQMYQQLTVQASDLWVVDNTTDAELTLTTYAPKGSALNRLVVKARLVTSNGTNPAVTKQPPGTTAGTVTG